MITWTRIGQDGKERLIRTFDSIEQFDAYMRNTKDPEKEEIPDGCWNCMNFDWKHEACTINWNNLDESYYNPATDDRKLMDCCEYHEIDPDADPECIDFGGNEP